MSEFRCDKHNVYDRKCPKCIPEPPFMRIGDKGETVNPKTGERIPPPTTEYRKLPSMPSAWFFPTLVAVAFSTGAYFGYKFPRDVELESTAPVELHFEISPEVEKSLILRGVKGCGV